MFESVIIRKHRDGPQTIDVGLIAESLLFYNNVHIIADGGIFGDLLKLLGPENLLRALDMRAMSLTYFREITGVYTDTKMTFSCISSLRYSFPKIKICAN